MAAEDVDSRLAGYCGLYCGACDMYQLSEEGRENHREPEWSELPERIQKHLPAKPSAIRCEGCRSDVVFAGCAICGLRTCAKKKGNVSVCPQSECHPCLRSRLASAFTWLLSLEKKLPHQTTRKTNLARIACVGEAQWLAEQDKAWRCPQCSTKFAWYSKTCKGCGRELESLKGFAT